MKANETKVSLVIPTYNERDSIESTIEQCREVLSGCETEILVVDDDSPDRTWRLVRRRYTDMESIRVIRRTSDRGLARSVSRGFQEATGEFCAVIDADLQHPPEKLVELFEALSEGADVAVATRYGNGGGTKSTLWRRFVSTCAFRVATVSVPPARTVSDPLSGFFAIRRELIEDVDLDPSGYKIFLEVLARCEYNEVAEISYVFSERDSGESKLGPRVYLEFFEHMLMLAVVSRTKEYDIDPQRLVSVIEYGLVGASGILVNMAIFSVALYVGEIPYLFAGMLAFVGAVNSNFFGNWMVTFDRPDGNLLGQYLKFHAVSVVGFGVYLSALIAFVGFLSVPMLVANLFAIGTGAIVNFLGSEGFAFK